METWTIYFRDSIGGCSTFFFLMVFFLVFLVFSSTFTDQYLIKDLRIPLQISRALYLCVAPSSLRICFTNISCLVLSRPWTLSSQLCLLNSPRQLSVWISLHGTHFFSQWAGALDGLDLFVFRFSGITVLHWLLSAVWELSIFVYFVQFLVFKAE